jgi:hypothetical protein
MILLRGLPVSISYYMFQLRYSVIFAQVHLEFTMEFGKAERLVPLKGRNSYEIRAFALELHNIREDIYSHRRAP